MTAIKTDAAGLPVFPEHFNLADYFLFDRLREGLGHQIALRFGDRAWSYTDVAERSRALARWLIDHNGLPAEARVYVVLPDVPPFAWSVFGTFAAGGVLTMGNPVAPTEDLVYVLGYVKARVLITTAKVAEAIAPSLGDLPHLLTILLVPDAATGEDPAAEVVVPPVLKRRGVEVLCLSHAITEGRRLERVLPQTHRDAPACWLFTSGSTGKPKAAMHSHRDFAFNTEVYAKRTVGYRPGDVTVSVPRLFFGYATGTNLWFPFAVGATVGLFSERPTAESLAAAIARYRPTIVTNVPTMLGKLLDLDDARRAAGEPGLDLGGVRFHLSAGEALPPALYERFVGRFGGEVYDGIGSAEMFHIYCSNRPGDVVAGSLGRAVEGYTLRVLPEDAEGPGAPPVPPGEIGVLWVKGDSVAHGYHQDRDRSWHTFHGHWCRTGDLFRVDEHGYLWFAGRADDLFKVGGVFVAPLEVEECLLRHPAVSAAAVVPADDGGLTKPKAFVVVRPDHRAQVADAAGRDQLVAALQAHVRDHLSKHKYPRWIEVVDELPRNDRGKVDKQALIAASAGTPA
ncbi:MAG: benzoate-CoA ligase family protein [Kofleriaceae bacterium]|nr:benzoate-CoA ligase family protein [Myxococcales bacterium]MCB9564845.1 benzoate-CoA ligase family protein [Kofleriaceae bacterium]MCB9574153.1 benzoate-CoA ligase family protein [Kofleriaceae bacterium]